MSQTLYEEAIAEARRLTEMAEQNAKNKIIDAVTPQIKRMIEAQLLSDNEPPEEMVDDEGDEDDDEEMGDQKPVIDLDSLPPAQMTPAASMPGVTSFNTDPEDGSIDIETDSFEIEIKPKTGLEEAIAASPASRRRLRDRIVTLEGKVRILKKALGEARGSGTAQQKQRLATIFEQLAMEAASLRKQVALTEGKTGGRTLETNIINSIIKEMNHMSRRANKNVFDFLFEADDDKPAKPAEMDMDMDMDVGDAPAEEMGSEDAAEDMSLSDIADQLAAIQDAVEKLASEEQPGEDESEEADEAAEDESDEDEDEMEEGSAPAYESDDMKEMQKSDESMVYEIDEAALRGELRRLRKINEADAVSGSGASSFGGGKATDDMFVDVDEETLLNALADELGSVPRLKKAPVTETRRPATRSIDEAAVLRRQVADYRNVAGQLKQQLVEMNLFNAKLLYANKLMQNRDLSAKQQRAIVEALDNAKTLREAKLLYKSLTDSLTRAANSGSLTEGRSPRILGSSSKSARSAQPNLVTEGAAGETDRWALLAGIKKD
jgi:hypothetical protein